MPTFPPLAAEGFTTFGTSHWLALAGFALGVPLVIALGRSQLDQRRVGRWLALGICAFTVPLQVIDFLPGNFSIRTTLPLQLCDLAWVVAVGALWTRRRLPVAITYFWGLTLSVQGLLTPSLEATWPDPKFVMFWGMHYLIVWSAIYLIWGDRDEATRPDWAGYRGTVVVTLVWLVAVFGVNVVLDTNYGYLNAKPGSASALDYLGPWPVYLLAEIVIVAAVWAAMTWPWVGRAPRRLPSGT